MSTDEVFEKVKAIIVEQLGVNNNYFTEESRYITEQYRELVNKTDK